MKWLLTFTVALIFALGWLSNSVFSEIRYSGLQAPLDILNNSERLSPADHLSVDQIQVYDDYAIINVPGLSLAKYEDTNSMDPLLDSEATGLEIVPREEDIKIGDIVAYRSKKVDGLIVHRIVNESVDENGKKYYVLKGDNNSKPDLEPVYFDQIEYLLVMVGW